MSTPASEAPLATGEVATLFGVTPETVATWADAGKLPFFRTPGGHRRFLRVDLDPFLEADVSEAAS